MKYTVLDIPGVVLIEPDIFGDSRGFFMETWREDEFKANVGDFSFVQDNHSSSGHGILRGLHYQINHPQGKLVRVISGEIFDVAIDLRKSSSTFGKWTSAVLTSENKQILWIPPGFAHGFYVLSDKAEFVYKCTDYYAPKYERCIKWDDPALAIKWPIQSGSTPILSDKDEAGISFQAAETYK